MMTATIKRILVPVDFSAPALEALDYAIEFGRPFKAEIVVLHVVDLVYPMAGEMYATGYTLGLVSEELRRAGREQLARLAATLKKRHVAIRPMLSVGTAYDAIVGTASKIKADMIIMSTHGRTGLSRVLMGSVAASVVRSARCPVLTVRGGKQLAVRPRRRRPAGHRRTTRR